MNNNNVPVINLTTTNHSPAQIMSYVLALKCTYDLDLFQSDEIINVAADAVNDWFIGEQAMFVLNDLVFHKKSVVIKFSCFPSLKKEMAVDKVISGVSTGILRSINDQFPDLYLQKRVGSQSLTRLWHRPYFLQSIAPLGEHISLEDYCN